MPQPDQTIQTKKVSAGGKRKGAGRKPVADQRLVRSCCKCGMEADTYCQSCAESRAAEKVGSVAAILYNALRFLGEEELHRLGIAIAERSNATFKMNAEAIRDRPEKDQDQRS